MANIIATEKQAATIGGGTSYTANLMVTRVRAVALGCSIRNTYTDKLLVCLKDLYKLGCTGVCDSNCACLSSNCTCNSTCDCTGGYCSCNTTCTCTTTGCSCTDVCSCEAKCDGECSNCTPNACVGDGTGNTYTCTCNTTCSCNNNCGCNTQCGCDTKSVETCSCKGSHCTCKSDLYTYDCNGNYNIYLGECLLNSCNLYTKVNTSTCTSECSTFNPPDSECRSDTGSFMSACNTWCVGNTCSSACCDSGYCSGNYCSGFGANCTEVWKCQGECYTFSLCDCNTHNVTTTSKICECLSGNCNCHTQCTGDCDSNCSCKTTNCTCQSTCDCTGGYCSCNTTCACTTTGCSCTSGNCSCEAKCDGECSNCTPNACVGDGTGNTFKCTCHTTCSCTSVCTNDCSTNNG